MRVPADIVSKHILHSICLRSISQFSIIVDHYQLSENQKTKSVTCYISKYNMLMGQITCAFFLQGPSRGNDLTRKSITSEMFRFQDKSVEKIFWVKTGFPLVLLTYMFPKHSDYLIRIIIPNKIQQCKICPIFHYNYYLHAKRSTTTKWK